MEHSNPSWNDDLGRKRRVRRACCMRHTRRARRMRRIRRLRCMGCERRMRRMHRIRRERRARATKTGSLEACFITSGALSSRILTAR